MENYTVRLSLLSHIYLWRTFHIFEPSIEFFVKHLSCFKQTNFVCVATCLLSKSLNRLIDPVTIQRIYKRTLVVDRCLENKNVY